MKCPENLSEKERFIYYWMLHFSVICGDRKFVRFFYEFMESSPDCFLTAESANTLDTTRHLLSLNTFMDRLELNLELINACGARLGQYCMEGSMNAPEAAMYMVRIMQALNNEWGQIGREDIQDFLNAHPEVLFYRSYDMKNGKLLP